MDQEKSNPPPYPVQTEAVNMQPPGSYATAYGATIVVAPTPLAKPPPDHLVWSILMIFCCWPFSIPAIIYSCNVRDASRTGDLPKAESASRNAKCWNIAALVTGLLLNIAWIIYVILVFTYFAKIGAKRSDDYLNNLYKQTFGGHSFSQHI
ncbi:proline-rich transmembrane protein 1-like [Tubulanus polymorphus]|uniref:proline-rich transmembrane protein 1-like n=1 Tax=Tubulanus polymorphus TaxID=672921 RepID=UPI003DA2516B